MFAMMHVYWQTAKSSDSGREEKTAGKDTTVLSPEVATS